MPRGVPTIIFIFVMAACVVLFSWWAGKTFAPAAEPATAPAILPGPANLQTFSAMSANVRLDDPADGAETWIHRRDLVVKTFLKYQPDIIACQEVSPAQGAFLNKELSQWYSYYPRAGVGASSKDTGGAAAQLLGVINDSLSSLNTLYYRKDRFDIVDGESGLVIPEEPQANATENTYFSLAVLKQKVPPQREHADPSAEETLIVVDVHIRHNEAFAAKCATRLRDKLGTWMKKYPACGAIVLGDMNHPRGSAMYKALTTADAKGAAPLVDLFDYTKSTTGQGTYHAFKGVPTTSAPSDLIFSAGTLQALAPLQIIRDHADKLWPSDHFFVEAELQFTANRE